MPTARPGHRAPHVWIEDEGRRTSTLDLFGDGFVLLADHDGVGPIDTDVPLDTHVIQGDHWRTAYGLEPGGAVLVRPDGHVAWRALRRVNDLASVVPSILRICTQSPTASPPGRAG